MGKKNRNRGAPSDSEEECAELLEDDNPTREFYECLGELFERFDVDGDGALNATELCTFSRAANSNGQQYSEEELSKIREFFEWDDGLTLQGWLQMYVSQARNDEDGTWQDLKLLGYNDRLELIQACAGAKFLLTRNLSLQVKLEELVTSGSFVAALVPIEAGELRSFVAALVMNNLSSEEQEEYVKTLQGNGGAHLRNLVEELKCCATGRNILEIDGDQDEGPVTFNFWEPISGGGDSFSFVCQDHRWCSEEMRSFQDSDLPCPSSAPQKSKGHPYCKKR